MKYLPNYMRPTSSSDARKDYSQVTRHNSPSVTSSSKTFTPKIVSSPPSITSKRNPAKPFLKRNKSKILFQQLHLNRATCSSTLKDSKFPKALDLNHGGTESDGTSVFRVCPYTYCSLNGHAHEPLPPLKSFLASKRKLIKTQQSMKLKGFSPFRKKEPKKSEKEVSPLMQEVVNDFIVEIYASGKEKIEEPAKIEEKDVSECHEADKIIGKREREAIYTGLEHSSDFSIEEMDAMVKFVEYVSCDQGLRGKEEKCSDLIVEAETEEKNPVGSDENSKKLEGFKEYSDHVDFMEYLDVFSDNQSFSSEFTDGGSDRKSQETVQKDGVEESVEEIKEREEEIESGKGVEQLIDFEVDEKSDSEIQNQMDLCRKEDGFEGVKEDDKSNLVVDFEERDNGIGREEEISEEKEERKEETNSKVDPSYSGNMNSNNSLEVENTSEVEIPAQKLNSSVALGNTKILDIDELSLAFSNMGLEGEDFSFDPTCQNQKTRLIFAKRRDVKDDPEYLRKFNPRAPNFLELEADPSGEKVDLRHQSMDDRKNAEEWMIDYALRRAVDELAPARKKKVQLLVAAFETVVPIQGGGAGVTCN
ncbi:hypothetical protein LUZ60_003633 [Juncus effusus]|nr:hypothetical protein LUZ60_003633 [Juncus effusus]